jgi:ubiquinone/menaquinone biosynthesis C-methylase UbiE
MKTDEKNYNYWQNVFDSHGGYMLAAEHNEYAILRDLILTFVDDRESILDLGCASGGTYDWIKEKKRKVTYKGTDYAEKFIEANRKRHPNIIWEVEDCRQLAEEDGEFDVVVLYDVLDGLDGWHKAIEEARRVAAKKVIVLMWCDAGMDDKRAYMEELGLSVLDLKIEGNIHFHRMLVGFKL